MKRISRTNCTLALLLLSLSAAPSAHAVLQARGAVNPANGFPGWYQDANGLAVGLCLEQTPIGGAGVPGPTPCLITPDFDPDPAAAAFRSVPGGPLLTITPDRAVTPIAADTFPDESFYFVAEHGSLISPLGAINLILYEAAIEAGFASTVLDGGQAVFTRIRIRANVTVPGTYTVTHPYGTETFNVGAIIPGPEINFTNDIPGLVPQQFDLAVTGGIGFVAPFVGPTFLTRADGTFFTHPVTGDKYIGDNTTPVQVKGGPNGNIVTITGPTDTLTFDTFVLMGKVNAMEATPASNDFGLWKLGATTPADPAKSFTLVNMSGAPATITLVSSNPAFTVPAATDTCTTTPTVPALPSTPGTNSCSFEVAFTPTVDGPVSAEITVNASTSPPVKVTVTGTGDSIPPTLTLSALNKITNTSSPLISGTVSDLSGATTVTVSANGAAPQTATITDGTWSIALAGLLLDVSNPITVVASDFAQPLPGNSTTLTDGIVVDTINPAVAIAPLPSPTTVVGTQAISGTASDTNGLSSLSINRNGILDGLASVDAAGNWSFSVGNLVPNEVSSITAVGVDPAGNAATSAPVEVTFVVPLDGDIDLDGTVNVADALLALRIAVNLVTPTLEQRAHGDVFPLDGATPAKPLGDKKNDVADALLILRKVVNLVTF